jgi:hypothetical protein
VAATAAANKAVSLAVSAEVVFLVVLVLTRTVECLWLLEVMVVVMLILVVVMLEN